jgi:hypothetical protein
MNTFSKDFGTWLRIIHFKELPLSYHIQRFYLTRGHYPGHVVYLTRSNQELKR